MIHKRLFILLILAIAGCESPVEDEGRSADLLLTNARVYTLDWTESAPDGSLTPDKRRARAARSGHATSVLATTGFERAHSSYPQAESMSRS